MNKQRSLTENSDRLSNCLSCIDSGPEFAIGVTGKELVILNDEEKKTLLREKDLEVVGLS